MAWQGNPDPFRLSGEPFPLMDASASGGENV
jgi:hypothetical protein